MLGDGESGGWQLCSDKIIPMIIQDLESVASVIKPIAKQIELLSQRINANRSAWSSNETATRLQLIDPLLRQIGWDTADPDQVTPEYSVGSRSADYVLRASKLPIAVVEAKNLGVKIDSGSRLQAHSYVDKESIRFVIVTNGDRWELYSSALSETKPLGEFTISRDAPHLAAIEAAKISREVLVGTAMGTESGVVGSAAPAPEQQIFRETSIAEYADPGDWKTDTGLESYESASKPIRGTESGASDGWLTLDKLEFRSHATPPKQMMLPDGETVNVVAWKDLWVNFADWLLQSQSQTQWKEYFGRFVSELRSDRMLSINPRKLTNGLWLATNFNTVAIGKNIHSAARHFGVPITGIKVSYEQRIEDANRQRNSPARAEPDVVGQLVGEDRGSQRYPRAAPSYSLDWVGIGNPSFSATGKKPQALRIGNYEVAVSSWSDFATRVAKWMIENQYVNRADCPIIVTRTRDRCYINIEPHHVDGTPFRGAKELPLGMWIEGYRGADFHIDNLRTISRRFGITLSEIEVRCS